MCFHNLVIPVQHCIDYHCSLELVVEQINLTWLDLTISPAELELQGVTPDGARPSLDCQKNWAEGTLVWIPLLSV